MKSKVVREPIGTWWSIQSHSVSIVPVDVVSVTDSFVTYIQVDTYSKSKHESRESRRNYFPSFGEAKAEAVKRAQSSVESLVNELQRRRSALGQWESLKEPK